MDASWYTGDTAGVKHSLVALVVCLWLYWLWSRRDLYRVALQLPGHFGPPIIGSFIKLKKRSDGVSIIGELMEEYKSHTVCVWLGLYPAVLTEDPVLIEQLLSASGLQSRPNTATLTLKGLLGDGLLSSHGESWQRNRKLINPSFNHKVLRGFLPVFNKGRNAVLMKLATLAGSGEHKICRIFQRASLGVTVETTMGKVMQEGDMVDEKLGEYYSYLSDMASIQTFFAYFHLGSLVNLLSRFREARRFLQNFVHELIISKLKSIAECKANPKPESEVSEGHDEVLTIKKPRNIFIDHAIQLYQKQQFTWTNIIAESNTIVGASVETTSTSIFATIVMLAMHPEIQERLYEEIVEVFPDKDFQMTYEHMDQLPYLDRVINESMRLTPTAPLILRYAHHDIQLTKELKVPKGLQFMISVFDLHRRADIWGPNASKFDPDHFLPENLANKHAYAFIPFSKGVRQCIGWQYALLFIKVIICGLVRNFRFTTTFKYEDLKYVHNLTLVHCEEPGIAIHHR